MMRILILTNRVPYPLNDGGNLAVHAVMKGLIDNGADVSLLSMNTTRHWVEEGALPEIYGRLQSFDTVKVDNKLSAWGAFSNLISGRSYHIQRFISGAVTYKLVELLGKYEFDIIHLEGLFVTPYIDTIRQHTRARIVYRQHNIEYRIWEHVAENESHILKKKYIQVLSRQLSRFELAQFDKIDYILPISYTEMEENKKLGAAVPQFLVPFGIEDEDIEQSSPAAEEMQIEPRIYHIGAMDWMPNREGIDWFLGQVWDNIHRAVPEATFHFAGRHMPDTYLNTGKSKVYCAGEVKDAAAFEKDKHILIVPLHSASGIRIKLLKALAAGKAVVSTSMGARGLELDDNTILIADTAQDFAEAVVRICHDKGLYKKLSENAIKLIKNKYSNSAISRSLFAFYKTLIS